MSLKMAGVLVVMLGMKELKNVVCAAIITKPLRCRMVSALYAVLIRLNSLNTF